MQRHLYKHFQLPGRTGHTVFLLLSLRKTDLGTPTKHEDYWIHTPKTKVPAGLNIEGGY